MLKKALQLEISLNLFILFDRMLEREREREQDGRRGFSHCLFV